MNTQQVTQDQQDQQRLLGPDGQIVGRFEALVAADYDLEQIQDIIVGELTPERRERLLAVLREHYLDGARPDADA